MLNAPRWTLNAGSVRRREREKRAELPLGTRGRLRYNEDMIDEAPDYAECSLAELVVMRSRMSERRAPERYHELVAEIQQREAALSNDERRAFSERMRHNTKARLCGLLFLFIILIFGRSLVFEPLAFTLRSKDWQQVPCVVSWTSPTYTPENRISYSYIVNGRRYAGERLTSFSMTFKQGDWLKNYPDGSKAQCLVNPQQPEQSVLVWGWGDASLFFSLVGLFLFYGSVETLRRPERVMVANKNPWTREELKRLSARK